MNAAGGRPSRGWRWLALLLAIALLVPMWWRRAIAPLGAERIAVAATPTHVAWPRRSSGQVHALAQCGACHSPDERSDASSPMLARWSVERLRMPAADDAQQVRAGGDIYRHACTRCHERDRHASSSNGFRPLAVSIDRRTGTAALDARLSDERMAALAAFLRRHAGTLPWLDGVRTAQDARL